MHERKPAAPFNPLPQAGGEKEDTMHNLLMAMLTIASVGLLGIANTLAAPVNGAVVGDLATAMSMVWNAQQHCYAGEMLGGSKEEGAVSWGGAFNNPGVTCVVPKSGGMKKTNSPIGIGAQQPTPTIPSAGLQNPSMPGAVTPGVSTTPSRR